MSFARCFVPGSIATARPASADGRPGFRSRPIHLHRSTNVRPTVDAGIRPSPPFRSAFTPTRCHGSRPLTAGPGRAGVPARPHPHRRHPCPHPAPVHHPAPAAPAPARPADRRPAADRHRRHHGHGHGHGRVRRRPAAADPAGRPVHPAAWDDLAGFTDAPAGGSVYYELASGTWVSTAHRDYATFLASQGPTIRIGISWKDNPPGYTGGDRAARSRAVTQELADGQYADRFTTLIDFVNRYPAATFLLRIDYEVSSAYHCTDASCSSYKGAFARIRSLVDGRRRQADVGYVYHPVRGEYAQLYPGDGQVDRIGVSVFAHEPCLPIHDRGYLWNGTPPTNYDTAALQCRNPYIGTDGWGNPAAVWQNWTTTATCSA
ncbi:hypothetical protein [Kitasatospora arboriphila]|uniref:GH26 domain-containing protein n=1 Tax=Kitasatospora arboriphila TaxID=258052 RepID=A0ABN1U4L7_9ACTN